MYTLLTWSKDKFDKHFRGPLEKPETLTPDNFLVIGYENAYHLFKRLEMGFLTYLQ